MNTWIYVYGLLDAATPITLPTRLLLGKNLLLKRFSNFMSATAKDPVRLAAGMADLREVIGDPLFRTRIGKSFRFEDIHAALAYQGESGARAMLVPPSVPLPG